MDNNNLPIEQEYKGVMILANCKEYSQWTVDQNGQPYAHHYDFEGADVISYTTDEYPDVEFNTIDELKNYIDEQLGDYDSLQDMENDQQEAIETIRKGDN